MGNGFFLLEWYVATLRLRYDLGQEALPQKYNFLIIFTTGKMLPCLSKVAHRCVRTSSPQKELLPRDLLKARLEAGAT
jgi:hypothetical protein